MLYEIPAKDIHMSIYQKFLHAAGMWLYVL